MIILKSDSLSMFIINANEMIENHGNGVLVGAYMFIYLVFVIFINVEKVCTEYRESAMFILMFLTVIVATTMPILIYLFNFIKIECENEVCDATLSYYSSVVITSVITIICITVFIYMEIKDRI